ncbi:MAG TPA: adenylate cyclase regulatory domain-containing protein [Solirubrobacteraceae bacterium]|jgi:adenylate cyclase|nr:adenylate cyclase regulatory domain-containing protein [Solirubrobacteraceae bacterium]
MPFDPDPRDTHEPGGHSERGLGAGEHGHRVDFEAEGLLEGLGEEQREERIALLEQLLGEGVSMAELRRSSAEGTIVFLAAELVIGGRERYSAREIAAHTGVDLGFLMALRSAMGLPNPGAGEPLYTRSDLESVQMVSAFREAGIAEEEMLELTRTLGRGLSQAAEAMRTIVLRLVLEPGVSEPELARRYASATAHLSPLLGPLITNLLTLHLRQMAEGEAISAAERSGGRLPGSREVSVAFADLVGFTRLGEEVPPDELGHLAVRLEELTTEAIRPPVKLVKTIGDAVMLVSPEPAPLIDVALALIEAADAHGEELPQLRAGVAAGAALSRAGDWFGHPVNLASRITAIARPGSLLVERGVRETVREAYRWSFAGERRLRGISEPVSLFRARAL